MKGTMTKYVQVHLAIIVTRTILIITLNTDNTTAFTGLLFLQNFASLAKFGTKRLTSAKISANVPYL